MTLKGYKSKRTFAKTPEPKARVRRKEGRLVFVVQKHAARALHYDLRLEMEGVLKSWAVPKGPTLDAEVKRLAVMVEDHPLDYRDFEGVIPEGNYGAGSVIVWDRGYYSHPAAKSADESRRMLLAGLEKGDLKFVLHGKKLQGVFALVKTRMNEKSWLLIKKKDQFATGADVLKDNRSVVSDKTLSDVLEADPGKPSRQKKAGQIRLREAVEGLDYKKGPHGPMPHGVKPMLATTVAKAFDDPDWIFEVKWDGYRAIAEVRDNHVSLYSRNALSFNRRYPAIVDALARFGFEAVFDGEIVVVDERGQPDFQMLQDYAKSGRGTLVYYVFDLIHFRGHDLTGLPLAKRKELLKVILPPNPHVKLSSHVRKEGIAFFRAAREKGLEGIVAKHAESVYQPGARSRQWLKVKARLTQDAVVAGFTEPRGRRKHFGALVLGVFEKGKFVYIGHTGGGFDAKKLAEMSAAMAPLARKTCPFQVEPETNAPVTWLKPQLVCEVTFHGWTDDGILRQPVFLRLREDKAAREVVREGATGKGGR